MRFATLKPTRALAIAGAAAALFLFQSCKSRPECDVVMSNGDGQVFAAAQQKKSLPPTKPVPKTNETESVLAELNRTINSVKSWDDFLGKFEDIAKLIGMATLKCNNLQCANSIENSIKVLDEKLQSFNRGWRGVVSTALVRMKFALEEPRQVSFIGVAVWLRFSGLARSDWSVIGMGEAFSSSLLSPPKKGGVETSVEHAELFSAVSSPKLDKKVRDALMALFNNGQLNLCHAESALQEFIRALR